jgi:hypothetical protein
MQTCWCFRLSTEELVLAKRSIRSFSGPRGATVRLSPMRSASPANRRRLARAAACRRRPLAGWAWRAQEKARAGRRGQGEWDHHVCKVTKPMVRRSGGIVNRAAGTVLQFLNCHGEPAAIPLPRARSAEA